MEVLVEVVDSREEGKVNVRRLPDLSEISYEQCILHATLSDEGGISAFNTCG
jgi:hypothetical protein